MTQPLRQQLLQVAGLKEMRSESRMDAGILRLSFETGSDMDLIFIDVNEKVDRAMAFLPKEAERPKVMKTSALDIPAFYLDLSLKNEKAGRTHPCGLPNSADSPAMWWRSESSRCRRQRWST